MKQTITIVSFTILTISCKPHSETKFVFPKVCDTLRSGNYYYSPSCMVAPKNFIYAFQPISDSIHFMKGKSKHEGSLYNSSFQKDFLYKHYKNSGFEMYIDQNTELSEDKDFLLTTYYPPIIIENKLNEIDEEASHIAEITAEDIYSHIIPVILKTYPFYIVNHTLSDILISNVDNRLQMIQEAKDRDGKWKPIEYWTHGCTSFDGDIILKKDYLIASKIYIYKGPFQTELRIKIKNQHKVYYSKSFKGSIDLKQFDYPNKRKQISTERKKDMFLDN